MVEKPLLLSAIQNGPPGKKAMPHGFTNCESVCAALPEISETRLVWLNALEVASMLVVDKAKASNVAIVFMALSFQRKMGSRGSQPPGARALVHRQYN